jgi:hypothetical protein
LGSVIVWFTIYNYYALHRQAKEDYIFGYQMSWASVILIGYIASIAVRAFVD